MEDLGFVRVAAAIPEVRVADCKFNARQIIVMISDAAEKGVQIIAFPELCVTGYTCGDLFFQEVLLEKARLAIEEILNETKLLDIVFIIGAPVLHCRKIFNTAIVGYKGIIKGYVPKTYLPEYNEFYEKRWFTGAEAVNVNHIHDIPFGTDILFGSGSRKFSVEICEDLWTPIPPSSKHTQCGATIIFNLSASNELTGKNTYRMALIEQQSARCMAGYVYASSGWGESTTDSVYTGNAFVYENGALLAASKRFLFEEQLIISEIDTERLNFDRRKKTPAGQCCSEIPYREVELPNLYRHQLPQLSRKINPLPFIPSGNSAGEHCDEVFSIQISGLAKRVVHTRSETLIIGISGGLDSTLALLVAIKTVDKLHMERNRIIGITMPGFGTTKRTYGNALNLMKSLGITTREISIVKACEQHFKDIEHDPSVHDVTFENTQARERTQILMDIANQENGLVIGTGDMSELALGWATYNGDHMSMYAVNSGVPKTLVRHLVKWVAETQLDNHSRKTLLDIIDTPVSPELIPANDSGEIVQRTEDLVGPYELHDFFLYYMLRFGFSPAKIYYLAQQAFGDMDPKTILHWLQTFFKRFFSQQFKRSCMPDGPKVGSVNLSPRGDWRMPSDANVSAWMEEINLLIGLIA